MDTAPHSAATNLTTNCT